MPESLPSKPVILFDGVCNLCNHSVNFIIRHDPEGRFLFAPLQGNKARAWLNELNFREERDKTIILICNGKLYTRSTAALRIAGKLRGPVRCLYIFLAVPRLIRDAVYDWVSKNRYRWFGKKETCMVPTPELSARFITD